MRSRTNMMTTVDLTKKMKLAMQNRTPEDAKALLVSAHIIDPQTGGFDKRYFSKETVAGSLKKQDEPTI